MDWLHPSSGTCVPGCALYGRCHCGCGEEAKVHRNPTDRRRGYVRGRPYVFRAGHAGRVVFIRRRLVPIDTPRRLARWLIRRYGVDGAAELLGLHRGTLGKLAYSRSQRGTAPWLAERLVRVVLAHRRPVALWDTFGREHLRELDLRPRRPRPRIYELPCAEVRSHVQQMVDRYGLEEAARILAARDGGRVSAWQRWLVRVLEEDRPVARWKAEVVRAFVEEKS